MENWGKVPGTGCYHSEKLKPAEVFQRKWALIQMIWWSQNCGKAGEIKGRKHHYNYSLARRRNAAVTQGSVTRTSLLTSQLLCSLESGEDQGNSEAIEKIKLHVHKAHDHLLSILKEEEMVSTSILLLRKWLSLTECKWHLWGSKQEILRNIAQKLLAPEVQRRVRGMGQGIRLSNSI